MNSNILCADIGTTSLKIGIVNSKSEVVSFCIYKFSSNEKYISKEWLNAFIQCKAKMTSTEIDAICISGNGPTIVSQDGTTLLWNSPLKEKINNLPKTPSLFIPQIYAFKNLYPEEYNNSKYLYSGPEYLVYLLTKNSITVLPEERFIKTYWNSEELHNFNIKEEKLPPFVSLGYNAGFTTKEITEALNLKNPVPVFCAGPDFVSALIGTNTLTPGKVCDRAGSSEGINLCSPIFIKEEGIRTLPSIIPSLWNLSVINNKSGILFEEYKNYTEKLLNKNISYNELFFDSIQDKNSQGYAILSKILNNFTYSINKLKEIATKYNIPFTEPISSTGGQCKNSDWISLKAKESNTDICINNFEDSELIGNAVVANYGLKNYSSIKEAALNIVKPCKTFLKNNNTKPMKIYKLEKDCDTIIFDIDSTLYTNQKYAIEQVDVQIRYFAKKNNIPLDEARTKISNFRKEWSLNNDGKKISLGNAFIHFGVTIKDSIEMRKNLLEPKLFLKKDIQLIKTIKKLKKHYKIICVTNNPVLPARKTLHALGISELIEEIIGLDTCFKSKPAKEPFLLAVEQMNTTCQKCIAVGDRFDMDLRLPLEMGMSGILVSGVEDVYKLPELLLNQ